MSGFSRRDFLHSAAATAAVAAFSKRAMAEESVAEQGSRPVVIASANGVVATQVAAKMIQDGADTLDAVVAGVKTVELDPGDMSVGYGGLPNEDGVVELDACVMHGPSCRAGAVAALQNIKTPSLVAKTVMERTDHVMIVGQGALRFAKAHGFAEHDLLTDKARSVWLRWKETHSDRDDWLGDPDSDRRSDAGRSFERTYGTINCCAVDGAGRLSGVTTTSGLSFTIPGRVGDSPLIGAGLYVDNEIGAAGSTGRGEAVIKTCGSHTVVEAMRQGMAPREACLHALKRIVVTTTERRLKHADGRPNFDVKFYALAKDGRYAAAAIWSGAKFSVFAGGTSRQESCAYLYERPSK